MSAAPSDSLPAAPPQADPSPHSTAPFVIGAWRIEPHHRRACAQDGTIVKIDPRNMRVLQILAERQGEIVSPREIEQQAWEGVVVTPDSLYQSIRQLRQALGDTKTPAKYIETVPRRGYRLVMPVANLAELHDATIPGGAGECESQRARPSSTAPASESKHRALRLTAVIVATSVVAIAGAAIQLQRLWIDDPPAGASSVAGASDPYSLLREGKISQLNGRPRIALSQFERALRAQLAKTGEQSELVIELLAEIANAHLWLDETSQALAVANRATLLMDAPSVLIGAERGRIELAVGGVFLACGNYTKAEQLLKSSVALLTQHLGEKHLMVADAHDVMAELLHAQGKLGQAEELMRRVLAISVRARGANDPRAAHSRAFLSLILFDRELYAEAESEARVAVEILETVVHAHHPYLLSAKHALGHALVRLGRSEEGESLLRAELEAHVAIRSSGLRIARAETALAESLREGGRLPEAEHYLSLARSRLVGEKGWPAERVHRHNAREFERLVALKTVTAKL